MILLSISDETAPHVGNSSELSNNKRVSSNSETVTSSENERNEKGCHMQEETKDMLKCFVVTSDVASPESTTNRALHFYRDNKILK